MARSVSKCGPLGNYPRMSDNTQQPPAQSGQSSPEENTTDDRPFETPEDAPPEQTPEVPMVTPPAEYPTKPEPPIETRDSGE